MENKTITQMQNEKFTWIGGQNRLKTYAKDDVSINLINMGNQNKSANNQGFSIIFRNETWKKFGERIEIAPFKNRIMFRTSDRGIYMSKKSANKTTNRYAKYAPMNEIEMKTLKEFIGDYELKYDSFYELYYIENENIK